MNKFYRCKERLRNNYQSHNLIGHYPFWVTSSRNSTSFTRPFLTRRRAWAGHKTREEVSEEIKVRKFQLVGHDQIAKFKVANIHVFQKKLPNFFPANILVFTVGIGRRE